MTICAECQKLPLEFFMAASRDEFYLHPSLTSLLASASAGCKVCVFLHRQLRIDSAYVLPEPSTISLINMGRCSIDQMCCVRTTTSFQRFNSTSITGLHFAVEPFEGKRRPITEDTKSKETFRQIEKWLSECDAGHRKCTPGSDKDFLPNIRLVFLQSITTSSDPLPKLISGADLPPEHVKYIALSYARSFNASQDLAQDSNPQVRTTTKENVDEYLSSGIPFSELPLTIRDGIGIAQRLKVPYIWDPSLCIIKDSPTDWMVQSSLIAKIYAHAYVTIAASDSANIHEGYFRKSEETTEEDSVLFSVSSSDSGQTTEETNVLSSVSSSDPGPSRDGRTTVKLQVLLMKQQLDWGSIFNDSMLNQLGWAMQEREFSLRILHFTAKQVLWECRTLRATEGLPECNVPHDKWPTFPPRLLDGLHEIDEMADGPAKGNMWLQTVKRYSTLSLEKAEDKFPALASLAQIFANHVPDEYVAGFWRHDLLRSLPWNCLRNNRRHDKFVAPTWSWASVIGPVNISYLNKIDYSVFSSSAPDAREAVLLMPRILGVHVSPVTPANPYGPVKEGAKLRLRGYIIQTTLGHSLLGLYGFNGIFLHKAAGSSTQHQGAIKAELVGILHFDVPSEREELDPKEKVSVLYVHPWYSQSCETTSGFCSVGIALVSTGMMREARERGREYQRVGPVKPVSVTSQQFEMVYKRVGHVRQLSLQCFEGVRKTDIVII